MAAKFRKSDAGSIAVEFAFICPILMTLCLGICEFGMAFFTYNSAQQAAWDVTRQLSTGTIAPADAQAKIRDRLPSWAKDGADVPPPVLDASGSYKITVSIPLSVASPLHYVTGMFDTTLVATASFQKEGN